MPKDTSRTKVAPRVFHDKNPGLERDFKIKVCNKKRLSYIGLYVTTLDNKDRLVGQGGCRKRILKRFGSMVSHVKHKVTKVGRESAFSLNDLREGENEPLGDRQKRLYTSAVMSLMYLSRRTRFDMLFWNSYLASRCKAPNRTDMGDLCRRTLEYLGKKGYLGIRYKYGRKIKLNIWCDASHGLHKDGKGQMGIAVSLGSGVVHCRSAKLSMVTKSSFESEWVSMCEGTGR